MKIMSRAKDVTISHGNKYEEKMNVMVYWCLSEFMCFKYNIKEKKVVDDVEESKVTSSSGSSDG